MDRDSQKSWQAPAPSILICLGITAVLGLLLFRMVDLKPRVDELFFFSKNDPQVRVDNQIERTFPDPPKILLAAAGDVRSPAYAERLRSLSDALAGLHGVTGVQLMTRGPHDIEDAFESPLWSRLLISRDRRS